MRILSTLRNTYFKEHLTIAASETWFCQKELEIVFIEEFLSIKNLFLCTYWCSKNLESICFSKYLEIGNSSLEIFKDFVYSPRNLSYKACSYTLTDPIDRYQDPIDIKQATPKKRSCRFSEITRSDVS